MSDKNNVEPKEGLEKVMVVEGWNQHVYKMALKVNILLGIGILALLPFTIYGLVKEAEPKYFATNTQGGLVQIVPLNEPNLSREAIAQWAVDAITASYTMDYVNFRTQVAKSGREYFTERGSEQFKTALKDSGNLDALLTRRMVISTIVTSTPIINSEGLSNGVYAWQVDVPIRVTYENSDSRATQELLAKLLIIRESTLEKRYGVGIAQFVTSSQR